MRLLPVLVPFLLLATPSSAQNAAQLKQELRSKEAAAKRDPNALFEVGKWAEGNGLAEDAKRIFQNVLKIAPDHEGANKALGNEIVDGKWLTAKDAAEARRKSMEADFKAKGMVLVAGVWVDKDHVEDAKRGIFHHEGSLVTKDEMLAFMQGMVRHPVTGQLIEAKHLEAAEGRRYPIGTEGRWAEEPDADRYHADIERPWLFRTAHCTLISTLPIKKLDEVRHFADRGVERIRPILGLLDCKPTLRPTIIVAATQNEFTTQGTRLGDETSSYGAFLADGEARARVPYQGEVRPAVCLWHKEWGPFYLRHAAALAYVSGLCADAGADVPLWFLHACGGFASRFENDRDAGWFGEQHQQKGGVQDLKGWFNSFAINGEMESRQIDFNIYQAGLMISFAASGADDKVTAAMQEITAAFAAAKSKAISKGIQDLQAILVGKEAELQAHLKALIARGKG